MKIKNGLRLPAKPIPSCKLTATSMIQLYTNLRTDILITVQLFTANRVTAKNRNTQPLRCNPRSQGHPE